MADWSGFHRRTPQQRLDAVAAHAHLAPEDVAALTAPSALSPEDAQAFIENAVGSYPLPLGFAVGFIVDGAEVVVPMAVEESSVVAAASHGAKLAALGGGFATHVDPPVTVAQVEVRSLPSGPQAAVAAVERHAAKWARELDGTIPTMVARGGGVRRIEGRVVGDRLVVHVHVDCRDAMGANVANSLAERLAPLVVAVTGGRVGLRILTNLADTRLARATCRVPVAALGPGVAEAIVEADELARMDPYRAATHNKGILNGIDPVAIATGNDWRAVEAGAHAWAAREGAYRGLTRYEVEGSWLVGRLEMPMAVGTVGGVTRLHPTARACLRVLGQPDARRLAAIMVSVGLAQNLSALRALSSEGIQEGHMRLHAQNVALAAGLRGEEAVRVAARMAQEGDVRVARARELAAEGSGPHRTDRKS